MTEDILYHHAHKKALNNHFLENDWVWLYKKEWTKCNNESIYYEYCAYLVTPDIATRALSSSRCDIQLSSPVAVMGDYTYRSKAVPGFEHLVIVRDFYHTTPILRDIRIADEIIFYHKLIERKNEHGNTQFYSVENGSEILVCEISENSVRILNRYLAEYMAAKRMDLVCSCCSEVEFDLEEVDVPFQIRYTPNFAFVDISPDENSKFMLCIAGDHGPLQSWFNGKTVFKHTSLSQFLKSMTSEINYIIGTDKNGQPIFSSNDTHPYTPIYFRKDIVGLYNGMHNCLVEPLRISTPSFSLRCDNDNDGYVIVFLKDIQDIPYSDQYIWRGHNIPPDGKCFSNIFQSSILEGNWNGVIKSIDFIFRDTYQTLLENWEHKFTNLVFKPLHGMQINATNKICVLPNDDYTALKLLVGNLVLSLQESFNQESFDVVTKKRTIKKEETIDGEKVVRIFSEPPIDYFNRVCTELKLDCSQLYEYLKMLQSLRSYMLHRNPEKDKKDFKKARIYFGMREDKSNAKEVSYNILQKGVDAMNFLICQL